MTEEVDENTWVPFDNDVKFKASRAGKGGRRRRNSRSRSRTRGGRSSRVADDHATDESTVSTWMERPISTDSSWTPVAPPSHGSGSASHPNVRDATASRGPRQHTTDRRASSSDSGRPPIGTPPARRSRPPLSRSSTTGDVAASPSNSHAPARGRSLARHSPAPEESTGRGRSRSSQRIAEPRQTEQGARSSSRTRRSASATPRSRSSTREATVSDAPTTRRQRSRTPVTNRSSSRPPVARTLQPSPAMVTSNSIGPGYVSRTHATTRARTFSADGAVDTDNIVGRNIASIKAPRPGSATGRPPRAGIMEKLFGDSVTVNAKKSYLPGRNSTSQSSNTTSITEYPERVHSRILLSATVYQNRATNLWIATINTNQKGVATNRATAAKYLKAFAFQSEREARESAIANAPPKMMPFEGSPSCFICNGKFAVFRRPSHCRNCGACVCNSCNKTWPAKSLPELYNLKKEAQMKICKSCDYISGAFKNALLQGDYEQVVALYGTGNVNLRSAFPPTKGEQMHPIHCAVEGQNLSVVRWLMEDHYAPIRLVRKGNTRKKQENSSGVPILTSKGRSVLGLAMSGLNVDILRYIVVNMGMSVYDMKDLKTSLHALEAALLALPSVGSKRHAGDIVIPRWDNESFSDGNESYVSSSLGDDESIPGDLPFEGDGSHTGDDSVADACIICYANAIDCVITPCGHQICCIKCVENMSTCPVCSVECGHIRIYRP